MNPYLVLGVRESATLDDIKSAYHALVKKYHPEHFINNPLMDLANEKRKKIHEAFELLSLQAAQGDVSLHSPDKISSVSNYMEEYKQVRSLTKEGCFESAARVLQSILERDSEWYYLRSIILMREGSYDAAHEELRTAAKMDPGNAEYRNALKTMEYSGVMYQKKIKDDKNTGACCFDGLAGCSTDCCSCC